MNTTQEIFSFRRIFSSSTVVMPNTILILALIYFSFVVEQESTSSSNLRRFTYYVLIISDVLALIFLNSDYIFSRNIKSTISEYVSYLMKKILGKADIVAEKPDQLKEFIDKSVQQSFLTQEKLREANQPYVGNIYSREIAQGYGQPIYTYPSKFEREKEILNSKAKIDERLISEKFHSHSKSPFEKRFTGDYAQPYKNQLNLYNQYNIMPSESDLSLKSQSYRLIKSLQLSNKYTSKLKLGNENKDEFLSCIEKLDFNNYERFIENFKSILSHNVISSIMDDHYENIDHLNRYLENSLIVQIVESVVDDSDHENFYEELSAKMRDTNLSFSTVNVKNMNLNMNIKPSLIPSRNFAQSSGFNLLQDSQVPGERNYLKIFFGDNEKLSFLIEKIEEKLKNIKIQRERTKLIQNKEINEYREKGITNMIFSSKKELQYKPEFSYGGSKKKFNLSNPLKNQNKFNVMSDYADLVQTHNTSIEENLINLKQLIEMRIELNSKLSPFFIKPENNKHLQLIFEYVVWRLNDLKKNKFVNYKNDSGGNFYGETWISAFPTDSQIISSIFIKYMEEIYDENDIRQRTFLVNWPLAPKMEKNSNSLILYQMNPPSCEPHFNVYYEDELYYCISGRENLFFSAVIFLHLMRLKMTNIVKKLKIDDFMASIFKF